MWVAGTWNHAIKSSPLPVDLGRSGEMKKTNIFLLQHRHLPQHHPTAPSCQNHFRIACLLPIHLTSWAFIFSYLLFTASSASSVDLEGILWLSGHVILSLKLEEHPLLHCFSLGRAIPEAFPLISNLSLGSLWSAEYYLPSLISALYHLETPLSFKSKQHKGSGKTHLEHLVMTSSSTLPCKEFGAKFPNEHLSWIVLAMLANLLSIVIAC